MNLSGLLSAPRVKTDLRQESTKPVVREGQRIEEELDGRRPYHREDGGTYDEIVSTCCYHDLETGSGFRRRPYWHGRYGQDVRSSAQCCRMEVNLISHMQNLLEQRRRVTPAALRLLLAHYRIGMFNSLSTPHNNTASPTYPII